MSGVDRGQTVGLAAIEHAADGFLAVDDDLTVLLWNAAAERILGWSAAETIGQPVPGLDDAGRRQLIDVLHRLADGTYHETDVRRWTRADGSRTLLHFSGFSNGTTPEGTHWHGAFFRESGSVDRRLHQRNVLSRELVEAIRGDEVRDVLETASHELLGARRGIVLRPCESRDHLHGYRALGGYQEDVEGIILDLDADLAPWVDASHGTAGTGCLSIGSHDEAPTLFVPMGPRSDGWVLALVYEDSVPDDPGLPDLAHAVGDEAWIALQRASLVAELEGKVEILEATAAVASSAGLDLDHTVRAITRHAASALSCERSAIYLLDDEGQLHLAELHHTDRLGDTEGGLVIAKQVYADDDYVLVQDTAAVEELDGPWCRIHGAVAVLGLPLKVADRWVGVLVVAHTDAHPRGFTNLCQQVGDAVAQQAAVAIENARLFAAEQETVRRLHELDELKADYVAGLTHDLKTPLTGLLGFVQTLRRMEETGREHDRGSFLDAMHRQARRLVRLVDDMLVAARLDSGTLELSNVEPITLDEIVGGALDSFDPDRAARISTAGDCGNVKVFGDRSQLLRLVANLVENALKYSPDDAPVEVEMACEGDHALLIVRDEGYGIDADQSETIFERFQPGRAGMRRGSAGLGLFIVRGIARAHGGDVTVDSKVGEGSTFTVRLPVLSR